MPNLKTKTGSIEESRQYHIRYLRAINSPLRRKILRAIREGCMTTEDLQSRTGLNNDTLEWHLSILEHGSCVKRSIRKGKIVYKLVQEGRVVDCLR
ncbi:MAG: winged helix-turn-helix domain-containing protein [Candidatus Bathyarchaeota archaeon]